MERSHRSVGALVALICALIAGSANGQPAYPSRPIRLIVTFPAGGTADLVARIVAQAMSEGLRQSVVVDNRAGADGAIAVGAAARAQADGYNLLFGTASSMNGVPTTRKTPPYDPVVDFTPIGQVGIFGFFAIVNDAVPAQTLTELFDYARANPGKLNYGTGNLTSILTFAQLAKSERLDIVHIPYKGDALATNDFLTGRIQVMIATPGTAMPHVRTGKLRVLAVLLPSRSPLVPNVPTAVEAGLSSLSIVAWGGLFGPAGLPVEVVERLSRELEVVLARPGVRDGLDRLAFEARASSPAALGALVRDQVEVWQNAVQAARVERD